MEKGPRREVLTAQPIASGMPPAEEPVSQEVLDSILACQFLVAWAGERRSEPRRFGWWDTALVDEYGGGDVLARLAPRTHAWAALEAVREVARRVDAKARSTHGRPDAMRTIFFLGFELDERLADRLSALKRSLRPRRRLFVCSFPWAGGSTETKSRRPCRGERQLLSRLSLPSADGSQDRVRPAPMISFERWPLLWCHPRTNTPSLSTSWRPEPTCISAERHPSCHAHDP